MPTVSVTILISLSCYSGVCFVRARIILFLYIMKYAIIDPQSHEENYNFVFSDQSIILYKIYILYKILYNLEHNTDILL